VQAVIPQLMEIYWRAQTDGPSMDFVEVITEDSVARVQRARRLIRSVNTAVRAFECPPFPWQPSPEPDTLGELLADDLTIERELLARGVAYRVIYDQEHFDSARWTYDVAEMLQEGEQGRVGAGLPIKLILYDDWAAAIPIPAPEGSPSIGSIIVHRSPLLDGLSALFEAYWARAVPLAPDGLVAADSSGPADQQMIALMASGLTDEATARALGISRSTVQRRINDLMQAAGVRTRFQLGLALARADVPRADVPRADVPPADVPRADVPQAR
jgi:DNA-binding CsgD family transcriptional regulator